MHFDKLDLAFLKRFLVIDLEIMISAFLSILNNLNFDEIEENIFYYSYAQYHSLSFKRKLILIAVFFLTFDLDKIDQYDFN